MKIDFIQLASVPTAESLGASAKVLVVDGGEIKKTAKANVGEHPSGKLTITGTSEVNCAAYATAQVVDANLTAGNIKKDVVILGTTGSYEGGGGDFSTATVTIVNSYPNHSWDVYLCVTEEAEGDDPATSIGNYRISADAVFNAILYKGLAFGTINATNQDPYTITAEGNATVIDGNSGTFEVTGDCTITITAD